MIHTVDAVIVGSGIAGLRAALELGPHLNVAVLTKVYPTRAHSGAAQGGIGAALGNEEPDSWEEHQFDTIKGGDYLTDQDAAEVLAQDAPRAIIELEHLGVPFNRTETGLIAQRAFGGHTRGFGEAPVKRACYAADRTGRVLLDTLYTQAAGRGLVFYPEFQMVELLRQEEGVVGVVAYELATGDLHVFHARAVLLATGGSGKVFKTTSNCFSNTGDGLFYAYRAGCPLEDMEFVQFHPTGISGLGILLSEAARGEGGILRNHAGERFMERYAPTIKDLAARDVVSRAILSEVREGRGINGGEDVHLDLTALGADRLAEKLSDISSFVRIYLGLDPATDPIPVQPTCHYMMGGIPTNLDGQALDEVGQVIPGLYAAGESACVSVHGANRLGCNSLTDLVVFGRRAGRAIASDLQSHAQITLTKNPEEGAGQQIEGLLASKGSERVAQLRGEMQQTMMDHCSVFRTGAGLERALAKTKELQGRYQEISLVNQGRRFNQELLEALELESLLGISEVIALSALERTESRGAHYREDYPERDDEQWLQHTLVCRTPEGPSLSYKEVKITRFQPKPRVY